MDDMNTMEEIRVASHNRKINLPNQ